MSKGFFLEVLSIYVFCYLYYLFTQNTNISVFKYVRIVSGESVQWLRGMASFPASQYTHAGHNCLWL